MATTLDSPLTFFTKATPEQFAYVLSKYREVFSLHAQETRSAKKNGPAELIKLDNWYQETLPQLIKTRKDKQLLYDEIVQITKWKLLRGKFRPSILDLVRTNTETAIKNVTKKAFKKMPNIHAAITALTQLKGIAPATASAILVAHSPDLCPYMAEENMAATPGVEETDLSISEYMSYVEQTNICVERLRAKDAKTGWTPHKVELALWTLCQIKQYNSNLLDNMPMPDGRKLIATDDESNGKLDDDEQENKHDEGVNSNDSNDSDDNSNQSIEHKKSELVVNGNSENQTNGHLNGNSIHEEESNESSGGAVSDALSSENEDKSNDSLLNKETVTSSTADCNSVDVSMNNNNIVEQQSEVVESTSVQSSSESMEVNTNESNKSGTADSDYNNHINSNTITSNHNVDQTNDNATDQPDNSQPMHNNNCNSNGISVYESNNNKRTHSLKETLIFSSEENSNNNLSEENSNLSNSNLSYSDLHSTENGIHDDGPALKRIRVE